MIFYRSTLLLSFAATVAHLVLSVTLVHADDGKASNATPKANALQKWQDARFGMFVHWGLYSVPAGKYRGQNIPHLGEWIMRHALIPKVEYEKFTGGFAPNGYDAEAWVQLARDAGMKYMVVTAKHHDGFALFDSKVSTWDAVDATPRQQDLLMPIVQACRKQGMPLGFHYSQAQDWWHPGGSRYGEPWDDSQIGSFDKYLANIALPQIKELVTNYGPVASFFFDTPAQMNHVRAEALAAAVPDITLTNDRLYHGFDGDYISYETKLPSRTDPARPWELCLSCNDTWGYKSEDANWKSSTSLLHVLIDAVSRGGNVLLNVGPDANGRIPEAAAKILREMGAWLSIYGESIYGTRRSPFEKVSWEGGCTSFALESGDTAIYAIINTLPKNNEFSVPPMSNNVLSAQLLPNNTKLHVEKVGSICTIALPDQISQFPAVVKIIVEGKPNPLPQACLPQSNGEFLLTPTTAKLNGKKIQLERQQNSPITNVGYWSDTKDTVSWHLDISRGGTYHCTWEISCPKDSAGSVIGLIYNDVEIGRFVVPATGAWSIFNSFAGGTIKLPPSSGVLKLITISKPGSGVVNLRLLSLTPAQ